MALKGIFPFGEPVKEVKQTNRSPKKVFVLGVYASAVHARWIGSEGKTLVKALAVASEPNIFWRGDKTEEAEIIGRVNKSLPKGIGQLVPPSSKLNGPSGQALDDKILGPLGVNRGDAWLCDLVPYSCMNPAQEKAIAKHYLRLASDFGLPIPTVSRVPGELADDARRSEIFEELNESQATKIILLGDQPIRWFLRYFPSDFRRLSDFIKQGEEHYGEYVTVEKEGKAYDVLPLAHPRQIGALGVSSPDWLRRHNAWLTKQGV